LQNLKRVPGSRDRTFFKAGRKVLKNWLNRVAARLRHHQFAMVTRVEDFGAFHFATEFKLEVYRLIEESLGASRDFKYKSQLQDAVSGIEGTMSEGFGRGRPKEFALFLRYSLGSIRESQARLRDGIDRGYFREASCQVAFTWASRCHQATVGLWRSQERQARAEAERARKARIERKPDKAAKDKRQERRSSRAAGKT
jgi:four helix bundle protein